MRFRLNGVNATPQQANISVGLAEELSNVEVNSCIHHFDFTGLNANTNNRIEILLNDAILETVEVRTPPNPDATGDVTFAFASCMNFSVAEQDAPAFRALAGLRPHFTILACDNCYYIQDCGTSTVGNEGQPGDWSFTEKMLRRQMQARNHPEFADLALSGAVLSTWDDHDFSFNNCGGITHANKLNWVRRDAAAEVYRAIWPNPYRDPAGAIIHRFRWGPLEVFMPDARFFKDKGSGIIWGTAQLNDLITALRDSEAPVKAIVSSCQFLYNKKHKSEGHQNEAPKERRVLIDAIMAQAGGNLPKINGKVFFLSGDMHFGELQRSTPTDGGLLEFTSSGAKCGECKSLASTCRVSNSGVPAKTTSALSA